MSLKTHREVQGSKFKVQGFGSLATRMRKWMSIHTRGTGYFTVDDIYAGIGAEAIGRGPVQDALSNFVSRGEVLRAGKTTPWPPLVKGNKKRNRLQYFYNHDWTQKKRGKLNRKIYKAMRLISFEKGFSANDVQRLAGIGNIVTVHKTIKKLLTDGYLRCDGFRKKGVRWKENIYRVVDTDKFHKDLIIEVQGARTKEQGEG